jgi:hypothetical protein
MSKRHPCPALLILIPIIFKALLNPESTALVISAFFIELKAPDSNNKLIIKLLDISSDLSLSPFDKSTEWGMVTTKEIPGK